MICLYIIMLGKEIDLPRLNPKRNIKNVPIAGVRLIMFCKKAVCTSKHIVAVDMNASMEYAFRRYISFD